MRDIDFVSLLPGFRSVSCVCAGHVILGSVDGNRIWAKDLKSNQLTHLEVTRSLDSIIPVVVQLFSDREHVIWQVRRLSLQGPDRETYVSVVLYFDVCLSVKTLSVSAFLARCSLFCRSLQMFYDKPSHFDHATFLGASCYLVRVAYRKYPVQCLSYLRSR